MVYLVGHGIESLRHYHHDVGIDIVTYVFNLSYHHIIQYSRPYMELLWAACLPPSGESQLPCRDIVLNVCVLGQVSGKAQFPQFS